ncbi:hypothetical protein TspCOW1_17460 [Thiohalobacter sp. COW1]|uniref:Type IV pilus assembly protein PilX n=1 Tax=Thiohalobacter thiocyanaticus TaxID=585455 RepID=A0A1Z4VP87_9GAMM|nr:MULTISPECIES: PilX N-terminal domain-containing pilus assembly protein [Thiohalobacter]BAZ93315.1 type IV pilus assembly protein PilX [Thiohalobacter thiocyanaticus]BCO31643.1 hypothetical protein TspCOW1_17460 [Thiohalobacter sp. COW1]
MDTRKTGHHRMTPAIGRRQQGAILAVSLIMLLVMTLIGVTAMQNTIMEQRMAGNTRDINLAFQAAEAALREGEVALEAASLPDFDGTTDGYYKAEDIAIGNPQVWEAPGTVWITYPDSLDGVPTPPEYVLEELMPVKQAGGSLAADEPLPEVSMYRVTSRASGSSSDTQIMLQTTYKR